MNLNRNALVGLIDRRRQDDISLARHAEPAEIDLVGRLPA
jgi:hypothetical protein